MGGILGIQKLKIVKNPLPHPKFPPPFYLCTNHVSMLRNLSLLAGLSLAVACAKPAETTQETSASPETTSTEVAAPTSGLRIGIIYPDTLALEYEFQKGLAKTLEAKAKRMEADMERRGRQFEENVRVLQKEAPNLSQAQLQQAQMELAQKEQELMQYRDARAQELMQEQAQLNELIMADLQVVIDELQEELNLDFILSADRASNILYASPAFDITDKAVEKLNRNYKAKQTADAAKK